MLFHLILNHIHIYIYIIYIYIYIRSHRSSPSATDINVESGKMIRKNRTKGRTKTFVYVHVIPTLGMINTFYRHIFSSAGEARSYLLEIRWKTTPVSLVLLILIEHWEAWFRHKASIASHESFLVGTSDPTWHLLIWMKNKIREFKILRES